MRFGFVVLAIVMGSVSWAHAQATTSETINAHGSTPALIRESGGFSNDPRPFTMVEDTYPEGKGAFEIENTFSYNHRTRNDHGFNGLNVEHELEWGLADNLDLKIPIAYRYESSADQSGMHFDSAAFQFDLYLTNSYTDPIGIGLMGEVGVGESSLSFKTTLVLQKDIGNWVVAYNLGQEAGTDGVFRSNGTNQVTGLLVNSLGVAYSIPRNLRVGAQVSLESTYANWNHYDGSTVYAGPTVNYFGRNWWLTLGPSIQLTSNRDEPQYRLDLIFAVNF